MNTAAQLRAGNKNKVTSLEMKLRGALRQNIGQSWNPWALFKLSMEELIKVCS